MKRHGDHYDEIMKPSICIGQRLVLIFRGIASQLGNDDFCSHGPSFSFVLFFFFFFAFLFLHTLEQHFCQWSLRSFKNKLQQIACVCRRDKPGLYAYTSSDHNYAKCHGIYYVNTVLSGSCTQTLFLHSFYSTHAIFKRTEIFGLSRRYKNFIGMMYRLFKYCFK